MEIFTPTAAQRRFLVELLAAEMDDDGPVWVTDPSRREAMEELAAHGFLVRVDAWAIALTERGRDLAERLAAHMLGLRPRLEGCA